MNQQQDIFSALEEFAFEVKIIQYSNYLTVDLKLKKEYTYDQRDKIWSIIEKYKGDEFPFFFVGRGGGTSFFTSFSKEQVFK